jgi:hypothetical protein
MTTIQKEIKELMDEILAVTMVIRDEFPELYQHLDETPFLTSAYHKRIGSNSLEEYLNTIRSQLESLKKVQN